MYCFQCGTKLAEDANFCPVCGARRDALPNDFTPQELTAQAAPTITEKIPKPREKRPARAFWLGLISALLICTIIVGALSIFGVFRRSRLSKRIEGDGYDTPEQAVYAYLEAMRACDMEGMLATFAIETYVENIDVSKYFEGLSAWGPITDAVPPTNTFTRDFNVVKRAGAHVESIITPYILMTQSAFGEENSVEKIFQSSEDRLEFYENLCDPCWKDEMSKISIYSVKETGYSQGTQAQQSAKKLGAAAIKEFEVIICVDEGQYENFMTVAQYNDKWYNLSAGFPFWQESKK